MHLPPRIIVILTLLGLAATSAVAAVTPPSDHSRLLILNSYNEDEQWANNLTHSIYQRLASVDTVGCDMVYLNTKAISDSLTYQSISDNVFKHYADAPPHYIIMVGNFAITFRDRIREEWGEVPILLISRIRDYGPLQDYFVDNADKKIDQQRPLSSLRNDYNFTCIFVRDYTSRNVDLIRSLIPNMKKFVFMSDYDYVNKVVADKLQNYISELDPNIEFKWFKANAANVDSLTYYITHRCPDTGFLLSSWSYEPESTNKSHVITIKDLRLLPSPHNPIFTLRANNMAHGAIGGVFGNSETFNHKTIEVIEAMLAGQSMKEIPFYEPDQTVPNINYALLKQYGLSEKDCPADTVFAMKPATYWEKHRVFIIIIIVMMLGCLWFLLARARLQRHTIDDLQSNSDLIKKLPVPYTRIYARLTPDDRLLQVEYSIRNLAFDRMFEENATKLGMKHLHNDDFIEQVFNNTIKTGEPAFFGSFFEQTDSYFDFMVYPVTTHVRNDTTRVCTFDMFIIDNTHRHQAHRQIKNYMASLDLTMQIANLIPWQWDYKSHTLTMNAKFFDNSAESTQDITMSWADFSQMVLDEDLPILNEQFRIIEERESTGIHVEYRIKSDKTPEGYEWLETYAKVTEFDEHGEYIKMLGTIQNITARKHQEIALREAIKKANESDRLKSAFLANISHEIRTPLNAIVGFSHLLARSSVKEEREKFISIIDHNNDMLLTLVNDVLDLAKIESNTIDLHYTMCEINDLFDSIIKTMGTRVPPNVRLNLIPYASKCIVEADANRVSQVLVNLLTNACKFTDKGAITVGYEVHDDKDLYIYVRDSGVGVAPENRERIFERFVKVDEFAQGTGLGLAICRSIVERMGGQIGCDSAGTGRGSTFWFTIPYRPVHIDHEHNTVVEDQSKVEHTHKLIVPEIKEESTEIRVTGRPTILVAEDNPSNYWLIQHLLQRQFNLIHAQNGLEAYEIFKERQHDIVLIIMDINMPVMDGYGAVENIRTLSADVPIIAVTAYAFATDRERILSSGFNAFVSKPITETTIADAMRKYLTVEPLIDEV